MEINLVGTLRTVLIFRTPNWWESTSVQSDKCFEFCDLMSSCFRMRSSANDATYTEPRRRWMFTATSFVAFCDSLNELSTGYSLYKWPLHHFNFNFDYWDETWSCMKSYRILQECSSTVSVTQSRTANGTNVPRWYTSSRRAIPSSALCTFSANSNGSSAVVSHHKVISKKLDLVCVVIIMWAFSFTWPELSA